MRKSKLITLCLCAWLAGSTVCHAISESNYESDDNRSVLPFLKTGERFTFPSADRKLALSGIRFLHPQAKGLIVVVNGRSESWLKYGELFYDLYQKGYSVISYDHRGQGLSPHLVPGHPQIGYVDRFMEYTEDFQAFMERVVKPLHPDPRGLFLIAHSMGAAVVSEYLELHSPSSPFQAVVLSAPMFEINTRPYPSWFARLIVWAFKTVGFGKSYAIGEHNDNPAEPFEGNKITHSLARWQAIRQTWKEHPEAVIGGASNGWVSTSLEETETIRRHLSAITTPTLLLQAGEDRLVVNQAQMAAARSIPRCRLITFPESRHEILMERDASRTPALREIEKFFTVQGTP